MLTIQELLDFLLQSHLTTLTRRLRLVPGVGVTPTKIVKSLANSCELWIYVDPMDNEVFASEIYDPAVPASECLLPAFSMDSDAILRLCKALA